MLPENLVQFFAVDRASQLDKESAALLETSACLRSSEISPFKSDKLDDRIVWQWRTLAGEAKRMHVAQSYCNSTQRTGIEAR